MADVWEAEVALPTGGKRIVALKRIRPQLESESTAVQLFLREAGRQLPGSGEAIAVSNDACQDFPVGLLIEKHSHPAARPDVRGRKETIRVHLDQEILIDVSRLDPERGPPRMMMIVGFGEHRKELVLHAECRRAPGFHLMGLRQCETDLSDTVDY